MDEIKAYNADAERLEDALNAAESEFRWYVLTWGAEDEFEQIGFDCEKEDEVRGEALETLRVVARTKTQYERGRARIYQYVSRKLLGNTTCDLIPVIIGLVRGELEAQLES